MNKPTHTAYVVINPEQGSDRKAQWHEIGAIWPHNTGRDQRCRPHRLHRTQREAGTR